MKTATKIAAAVVLTAALSFVFASRRIKQVAGAALGDDALAMQNANAIKNWQAAVVDQSLMFTTAMNDSQQHLTA